MEIKQARIKLANFDVLISPRNLQVLDCEELCYLLENMCLYGRLAGALVVNLVGSEV